MNKIKYNKEDLEIAIKNSFTYFDVFKILGLCPSNYQFLKKKIKEYNIDISHFKTRKNLRNRYSLEELLKENTYPNNNDLKKKLYKSSLKYPICEECGQDEEWRGKKMSLILDHINGNRYDNRIENLRIICPNCNAILDTHCGKNKKINKINLSYKEDNKIKLENLKQQILNSGIDFSKKGWGVKLSKILNKTPQRTLKIVELYFPEIFVNCFKHNDRNFKFK